ncbi:hypothetical protein KJS94_12490 [Flavihumibacter rivuli]|uniref:hypothetical protein n=1 Tax=Flavihumibacter rivuli TaxID=2838156 RepID=UPI001BDF34E5|nr:hypothetical protein [Flavihumibacter rivuli]ULQ55461.1 hypothetical protein KJS94_12490 [Flavihumibacter rivuli]
MSKKSLTEAAIKRKILVGNKLKVAQVDFTSNMVKNRIKDTKSAQEEAEKRKKISWKDLNAIRVRI